MTSMVITSLWRNWLLGMFRLIKLRFFCESCEISCFVRVHSIMYLFIEILFRQSFICTVTSIKCQHFTKNLELWFWRYRRLLWKSFFFWIDFGFWYFMMSVFRCFFEFYRCQSFGSVWCFKKRYFLGKVLISAHFSVTWLTIFHVQMRNRLPGFP